MLPIPNHGRIYRYMIQALNKIIKNFIIPSYPGIVGYEIEGNEDSKIIRITYECESDDKDHLLNTQDHFRIRALTHDMFNMLGLNDEHKMIISFTS